MYQVNSPVLFLIFNRPAETARVFNEIRKVQPKRLYIAADGPRSSNENDLINCAATREVADKVDWPCELKTLFRTENKGCGPAVSEAINWFFDNEQEGIILEDDCLPHVDFFRFCDTMLDKYRFDERIGHVSGTNIHDYIKRGDASYYFSQLSAIWGWATWKRVWDKYDYEMNAFDEAVKSDFIGNITSNPGIKKALLNDFLMLRHRKVNTWDFQYSFSHIIHNRLSVIPNTNLISNIGFQGNGTHTVAFNEEYANVKTNGLGDIITHPIIFLPDKVADEFSLSRILPKVWKRYYSKLRSLLKV